MLYGRSWTPSTRGSPLLLAWCSPPSGLRRAPTSRRCATQGVWTARIRAPTRSCGGTTRQEGSTGRPFPAATSARFTKRASIADYGTPSITGGRIWTRPRGSRTFGTWTRYVSIVNIVTQHLVRFHCKTVPRPATFFLLNSLQRAFKISAGRCTRCFRHPAPPVAGVGCRV